MRREVLVGAAVLATAGCSAGGGSSTASTPSPDSSFDPQSIVEATAAKTAAATPASVSASDSFEGGASAPNPSTVEGAVDGDSGRVTVTAETGGTTLTTEIAHDGTVFYVKPPAGAQIPEGKDWVRLDIAEFSPGTSGLRDFLRFLQADPLRILSFVTAGIEDVEEIGPEQIRGVDTMHYSGTVNVEAAAEGSDELAEAFAQLAQTSDLPEFRADLWIDGEGVCRRLAYEFSNPADAGGGIARTTIEFFDFGEPVDLDLPSDEDAYDLGQSAIPTTATGEEPR